MLQDRTLCQYLYELAQSQPAKKLVGDDKGWMTAAGFLREALMVCQALKNSGIRSGNIAALQTRRSRQTLAAIFGIRLAGAIALLTGPYRSPEETLRDCEIQIPVSCYVSEDESGALLINGKNFSDGKNLSHWISPDRETMLSPDGETMLSPDRETMLSPDGKAEILTQEEIPALNLPEDAGSAGFIIFTSGTTGKSKAVTLSDRNLIANLLDSAPLGDYREEDIALGVLPFEHVFGLVLAAGMAVLDYAMFIPKQKDVRSVLSAIEREKITRMNGVPSLYQAMAAEASDFDLQTLRVGFIGGAPASKEQFLNMESILGMTLIPVYGMSECIGIACCDYRENVSLRCRAAAKVYSMNTLRIIGEDGKELPEGETGEVWVNGPARMLGYWPDRMEPEEFLPTGDLGYLTGNGRLLLTGRKKEIIIRNGKNLSPVRIENALLSLPGVVQAAVVGLPDERQGEIPYAMAEVSCAMGEGSCAMSEVSCAMGEGPCAMSEVSCAMGEGPCAMTEGTEDSVNAENPGENLKKNLKENLKENLMDQLKNLLPKNELPVDIFFVRALPMTSSGKPDKAEIRKQLLDRIRKISAGEQPAFSQK